MRKLAQRSAATAKEIKELIGDAVATVSAGSALVDEAGVTMGRIVESVRKVQVIMAEISAAGARQSAGIRGSLTPVNTAGCQLDHNPCRPDHKDCQPVHETSHGSLRTWRARISRGRNPLQI